RTWLRGPVKLETKAEGGLGKSLGRVFSGESLFMSRYTAQGPAEIAFSSSFPGSIVVRTLEPGESIICQKSAFLCATYGVDLAVHFQKKLGAGLVGGEGFVMQRVTGPGMVFLEVDGYCHEYDLGQGEQIICDTGVVAIMDATCQMDVRMIKGIKNVLFGGEGLFDTVVTGPGKVHLQTMTIAKLAKLMIPFIPKK
ncbi:MAG: AIM24 family protein, partial [Firmicutes bacterium]|nr:AIM24 family protein [Bacillota bacterium]